MPSHTVIRTINIAATGNKGSRMRSRSLSLHTDTPTLAFRDAVDLESAVQRLLLVDGLDRAEPLSLGAHPEDAPALQRLFVGVVARPLCHRMQTRTVGPPARR